jgi:hypothetical protein
VSLEETTCAGLRPLNRKRAGFHRPSMAPSGLGRPWISSRALFAAVIKRHPQLRVRHRTVGNNTSIIAIGEPPILKAATDLDPGRLEPDITAGWRRRKATGGKSLPNTMEIDGSQGTAARPMSVLERGEVGQRKGRGVADAGDDGVSD